MDPAATAASPVIDLYGHDTESHGYAHMKIVALTRQEWFAMARTLSVGHIFAMYLAALELPHPPLGTLGYDEDYDTLYVADDSPKA